MKKAENAKDFFGSQFPALNMTNQFTVSERQPFVRKRIPYNRRDFYKIGLIIGSGRLSYADATIEIDKPALIFSNPVVPYAWETISKKQEGFFCLFTEEFLQTKNHDSSLHKSPLFATGSHPVFFANASQIKYICNLFRNMIKEFNSDYIYRYEVLRNHVNLLLHEAMKMQPPDDLFTHANASSRIASSFLQLIKQQFPIDSPQQNLSLRTANDYAERLAVHVNHLNRAVKEITGKTTTEHISHHIVKEAKALLLHTDWSINEIAYSLGYEYPTYFTNFFKKQNGVNPSSFRRKELV